MIVDKIALILVIVGALNWGGVGLFGFDTVAFLFGGQAAVLSRIVYTLVGLAGLWCVTMRNAHLCPRQRRMRALPQRNMGME